MLFTEMLFAAAPQVKVSISAYEITVGERFQLTFTFENFSSNPEPDIAQLENFSIVSGPLKSRQTTWINGESTKIYSVTYTLVPLKTGRLTIPSFMFKDKRQEYQTESITLLVREPSEIKALKEKREELKPFYFEIIPSTTAPYVGEPFLLFYKIYFRQNIRNYHIDRILFNGYLTDYLPMPRNITVQPDTIQGVTYQTAILQKVLLTPTKSGKDTIPSQIIRLEVESPQAGRRSFFDDPFGMGIQLRNVDVVSPDVVLTIRSLPPNPPTSFTGAIGSFTMQAAFDTLKTEENQAVTLKINIQGKGNFKNFTFPKPDFPEQFMVFEPEIQENINPTDEGYIGSKTWEYVLIPNYQGTYYFEPIEFSYFSPEEKRYKKLMKTDLILTVTPNTQLIREQQHGLSQQEVELLSQDIRFIYLKERRIISPDSKNTLHFSDWLGYVFSVLICLAGGIYAGIQKFLEKSPNYRRKKSAFRTLQVGLKQLPENPEEILAALPKLFAKYVADKEGHHRQNLTRQDVMAYCRKKISNESLLSDIDSWWREVESLNYMPAEIDAQKAKEYREKMMQFIRILEKK
ncbi:MAG: BatD family protein [Candidatus Marinimicrobia bacterium]|nr:BatD family protein [Candidatus Neomarinimicrobiota bacterium]